MHEHTMCTVVYTLHTVCDCSKSPEHECKILYIVRQVHKWPPTQEDPGSESLQSNSAWNGGQHNCLK